MVQVGAVLYGFCGGHFGRDSYTDKRVEAMGADWLVVRNEYGKPEFFSGNVSELQEYLVPEDD